MMIPAIDLIDGQVVRLFQGDYSQKTNYQYTVQERQQAYAQSGATVMHFVDLDGAKEHASLSGLRSAWEKEVERFLRNFQKQPQIYARFKEELK